MMHSGDRNVALYGFDSLKEPTHKSHFSTLFGSNGTS